MSPTIYHGTPMTPRAALTAVMTGRAGCVSFYRPDDLEALLAVSPQLMFRPRRVLSLDGSDAGRWRMVRRRQAGLVEGLLPMARADAFPTWAMGNPARQSWRTVADQRWLVERLAVWALERCAGLAHGRTNRAVIETVRQIRPRLHRLGWSSQAGAGRLSIVPSSYGRRGDGPRQRMATASYAARGRGCFRVSLHQRGQHFARTEWVAL